MADLNFEDVMPAGELAFGNGPTSIYETFDGLRVAFELTGGGGSLWARVSAETDPALAADGADMTAVEKEAAEINARVEGWAYRLPQSSAAKMAQTLPVLTRDADAPEDAGN